MSGDWDSFAASEIKKQAVGNVTNGAAVTPETAVGAIQAAPASGVPASVAMHAPTEPNDMALFHDHIAILNTSPPVASFAATDSAKATATKDDFASLAKLADGATDWGAVIGHDFFAPGAAAGRAFLTDVSRWYHAGNDKPTPLSMIPGFSTNDKALGSVLADAYGFVTSPVSGALNVVARPLSYIPTYSSPTFMDDIRGITSLGKEKFVPRRLSQPEAQAKAANTLGLGLAGLGPEGGVAAEVRPPPINEGTFGKPLQIAGPGETIHDAEFTDITPPGVNPVHSETYSAVAELDAEHVARMQGALAETKTLTRAPELAQEFLQDHTPAGASEVSVPAESISKLWNEGHDIFADHRDMIQRALVTGDQVKIPMAQYLTETAGKPFAEELNQATQFRPNGVSLERAKDLPQPPEGFETGGSEGAFVAKPNTLDTNLIQQMLPTAEQFNGRYALGRANTAFQFDTEANRQAFMEAVNKNGLATTFEQSAGPAVERRATPRTPESDAEFNASVRLISSNMETRGKYELATAETPNGQKYIVKPTTTDANEIAALEPAAIRNGGRYAMGRAKTAFQFDTPQKREAFMQDIGQVPTTEPTIPADIEPELHGSIREIAARADQVVDQVFKENALDTLFTEPKAAGMTKGLFERYGAAVEQARAEIHDKLMQRTYNQIKRERTPDFKAAVQLHMEDALKTINGQQNVITMRALSDALFKIDRAQVPGELSLPNNILKHGGLSPDEAAELTGYSTGKELLAAMHDLHVAVQAHGGTLNDYIKNRAKVYAQEQARAMTGYDVSPNALLEAAREAVASPKVEDLLIQALQEVGQRLGIPLEKNTIRDYAEQDFATMNVKDAARPKSFSDNMKRLGDKAEKAILDGKEVEAFKFKQQQLIQFHQLKASYGFQKELLRGQKILNQIAKKPIVNGMDQTARNHLRWIARRVGLTVRSGKYEGVDEALRGHSLEDYMNQLMARGLQPVFADIPNLKLPDMMVDQFRGVIDTVKSIAQLGRDEKKAFNQQKALELSIIGQEVKANASAIGRPFTAGELHRLQGKLGGAPARIGRSIGSAVSRPETFLYWLDRETNGPLMKYLVSELQDGKYLKTDKIQQIGDQFREFVKTQPKGWQHSLEEAVDIPELTYSRGADGQPIQWLQNRGNVVMMATHFGTDSNFIKLIQGFGWDAQTVRDVANRVLSEADWKYVQHILDVNRGLLPEIKALYRATVGLAMKEVPATPIETPFGKLPGGYRHITYDWNAIEERELPDGTLEEVNDPTSLHASELFGPEYRTATPPNKYTLARTNFASPLNLEHSILHREIESVIHDLAFRPALIQATKVMRVPQVRQAVREALGPEYLNTINQWLKDIARGSSYDQTVLKGGAALVRGLRRRFTMVQIGYNVATLLKHGGFAASHISGEVGIPEFAKASSDLMRDESLQKFVDENSGEVRGSLMNLDRDVRELMQDIFRKQGFIDNYRYHAFTMFGKVKRIEGMATWLAKYRNLTDKQGLPHADAVALANKAVRDTQGAGSPVDLPALWRGDASFWAEVGKLSNIFTGFENTATNRAWTMIRRSGQGGKGPPPDGNLPGVKGWEDRGPAGGRRDFGKQFSDLLSYFVIPALYATAFDTVTQGKLHKGAKNGAVFLEHYMENTLKGLLGGSVPLGNMLAELPRAIQTRGKDFGSDSPVKDMFGATVGTSVDAWDAAHGSKGQHKVEDRWVQHAMETVGYIFNIPIKPLAKGGQFLWDKSQGHVKDKSMVEFFRGLVFGPSSEEAKKPK